ncbi:coniferyl aldehyde dehydrogenase [Neorhizobium galegae]|uniref:coniferyl aldehyde dehydrogenase n=1 Tax=Neorhizobium galegae TaxID=399 RepID=UPI0021021F5A|nr:coniferyl aldehyde dehydrogenase [Neorhizobium galegae]MCQ1766947.1 coniferyl aldehyde dehydrogenase [Neorhizobium galegae]MCQ1849086.1 coniferyl aldehyde dehydrogenase [Neorhizobium galegae]
MNAITKNADAENLASLLDAQRAAFLRDGSPSLARRRADLAKLKKALIDRRSAIEAAFDSDFGHRSRHETAIMEIFGLVGGIDYLRRNLRRFMRPERRHVPIHMQFGKAWIEYQPLGVVGVIAPWNYPVTLALMPVATAIAAGNRVLLKPSELTPSTSALLAEILGDIFPKDQVAVVQGDASVAAAFSALPFDHLLFTGSTQVGRAVMKAASDNLVPVTLELGGKSPVIVEKGHSLKQAASEIAFGKLLNAGQTCIAPDYAMVHESDLDAFVQAYQASSAALYPDSASGADYTSIINERHYGRLEGLIEDARAHGAKIVDIGVGPDRAADRPHTLAPVVLLGMTDQMRIAREEIFGPILPVITYRTIDEAIAYVNARPRPLALYYFGSGGTDQRKVLTGTTSGNVTINGTIMHVAQDDLPFGGVGASGIGAYHGIEGFKRLSHAKGIYAQRRWNVVKLFRAPFGKLVDRVLNVMLR